MKPITVTIIENLLNNEEIDSDIELSEDDKKHLFGKAKDFRAEASYFEIYENDHEQASKLYEVADKLCELGVS